MCCWARRIRLSCTPPTAPPEASMRSRFPAGLVPVLTISALLAACDRAEIPGPDAGQPQFSVSATTQVHFVANGDFGNASWFEADPAGGFTFGSISVNRGGPT